MPLEFHFILPRPVPTHDSLSCSRHEFISFLIHRALQTSCKHLNPDTFPSRTSFKLMTRINDGEEPICARESRRINLKFGMEPTFTHLPRRSFLQILTAKVRF